MSRVSPSTSPYMRGVSNPLTLTSAVMPPSVTFKADGNGISFSFENKDGSVTLEFDDDSFIKMVGKFTDMLDKNNVKYKIKTTKKKKR